MPIVQSLLYVSRSGFAKSPGYSDIDLNNPGNPTDPPQTFVDGETEPDVTNTGAGVLRAYPSPSVTLGAQTITGTTVLSNRIINGNVTMSGTAQIRDCIVNGRIIAQGNNVVENCVIRGGTTEPTNTTTLVGTSGSGYVEVRFSTLDPQTRSAYWNAMGWKNYKAYRCYTPRSTDTFGAFVSSSITTPSPANVKVWCCFSPNMTRFAPDYANNNRAETHNDTIQLQGNNPPGANDTVKAGDIDVFGNSFVAVHDTTGGTLPVVHKQIAAVMLTPNTQDTIYGTFRKNWFKQGAYTFNGGSDSSGHLIITDNRFTRPGSSGALNSHALVVDSGYTRVVSGNTYIDNGATVSAVNG